MPHSEKFQLPVQLVLFLLKKLLVLEKFNSVDIIEAVLLDNTSTNTEYKTGLEQKET